MARNNPPNRLGKLRRMQGLTLEDVASKLGVSYATVRRWELNQGQIPDEKKLELADLFGVDVVFLLRWERPDSDGDPAEEVAC